MRALHRARTAQRIRDIDVVSAIYTTYLILICAGAALFAITAVAAGVASAPSENGWLTRDGAAIVGLVVSAAVALSIRSGTHGGPMAISSADVHHVLLAPVSRRAALLPKALRLTRRIAVTGLVIGGTVGALAARRFGDPPLAWVLSFGSAGLLAGVLCGASAFVASALQNRRSAARTATAVAELAVIAWSAVDLALRTRTSPGSWIGSVAMAPSRLDPTAYAAVPVVLIALGAGLVRLGRVNLEALARRARLGTQVRFALTLRDIRTVMLLSRQLAQENLRARPWIRLTPLAEGRALIMRRDIRPVARWPASRLVRLVVLSAAAGLGAVLTNAGPRLLVALPAAALLVIGVECLEGLGADEASPDLPESVPRTKRRLRFGHVPTALLLALAMCILAWTSAVGFSAATGLIPLRRALLGVVCVVPGALGAVAGAAVLLLAGAAGLGDLHAGEGLPPELQAGVMMGRALQPLIITASFLAMIVPFPALPTAPAEVRAILRVVVPATLMVHALVRTGLIIADVEGRVWRAVRDWAVRTAARRR